MRAVLAVGALALAGCSSEQPGNPVADGSSPGGTGSASSAPPGSGNGLPAAGAPKVASPLTDTLSFRQEPCSVLTPAQLGQLGVPAQGEKTAGPTGPRCRWYEQATSAAATIQWVEATKRGLTAAYEHRGEYDVFKPMADINGYPTVAYGLKTDAAGGACAVLVGVTDELAYQAGIVQSRDNRGTEDPCEVAHTVAGMMLETIKGGS
ncbi:DUF3558 domain-containing protein [Amycolatopsis nigrescens]|uniref:DUF3558 domain-containing protein n=1 Tax=Amycolatopsis nigrescens TaxID=381445 RepID=UPI001FE22096|nr:DUF3558 domain-containing protein [Amycolatopsis nigrescens]